MQKIRWKWLWFLLLASPLVFTPVRTMEVSGYTGERGYIDGGSYYKGLTLGPQLALPLDDTYVIKWGFSGRIISLHPNDLHVDWGRICYWWAWVVAVALLFQWEPFVWLVVLVSGSILFCLRLLWMTREEMRNRD